MDHFQIPPQTQMRQRCVICYLTFPTMQKISSIIIALGIFLTSCNGQEKVINSTSTNTDTLKKEIPTYKDGTEDLFYKLKQQKATQLRLDSLESGYDSLQIRIWYDYALLTQRDLVIIKQTNGKWSGEFYELNAVWNAFKNSDTITGKKIKSVIPKSGWDTFIKKLFDLKIMTLPDMDSIPGLQDNWTDGVTYNFEIATKKEYRFYGYHLPEKFEDKFWQAKNITEILKLISDELMK
jgi:hypothetical protein